jgi:dTDP-L-rhamnose 4-epimerase
MAARLLVTGGFGFIGAVLTAKLLERGHLVTVLDNLSPQIHGALPDIKLHWADHPSVRLVRGDVGDAKSLDEALEDVGAVAHLAAETGTGQSMYEIEKYCAVNVQATAMLLDRIVNRKLPVRNVVLAGSRSIYGEGSYVCDRCAPGRPVTPMARRGADMAAGKWEPVCPGCGGAMRMVATAETAEIRPSSIYAATKMMQEELVRIACGAAGIPAVALRFQNVYGEGQSLKNPYTGIISIFSTRIRRGLSVPLYEDGEESRDFVHVDDVAGALVSALEREATASFTALNIGAGAATSVRTISEILIKTLGGTQTPVVTGQFREGDIRHCFADISAARATLGYQPRISITEGLNRFAAWALSQPLPEDGLDKAAAELAGRGMMGQAAP